MKYCLHHSGPHNTTPREDMSNKVGITHLFSCSPLRNLVMDDNVEIVGFFNDLSLLLRDAENRNPGGHENEMAAPLRSKRENRKPRASWDSPALPLRQSVFPISSCRHSGENP